MDSFSCQDVQQLLHNKFVVVIGDSIQRGIYKDLVRLLQTDCLLQDYHLKQKGEQNFLNDKLIEGGVMGQMTNAKHYKEVRQYQTKAHLVRFYIVTRCYGKYVETILEDLRTGPKPDVVIMNSCLWDVSRYGPFKPAMEDYKTNLQYLCTRMKEVLPEECLFIWNTTMPVGKRIMGGFLIQDLRWMENHLTWLVKEANHYAVQVMEEYGVDVNDLHYHFRDPVKQLERRVKDGIHWDPWAHRSITKLILSHICRAWNLPLFERQRAEAKQQKAGKNQTSPKVQKQPLKPNNNRRGHHRASTHDGRLMSAPCGLNPGLQSVVCFLDVCKQKLEMIESQKNQQYRGIDIDERTNQIQALETVITQCDIQLGYVNAIPPNSKGFHEAIRVRNRLMEICQLANATINWLQVEQMVALNNTITQQPPGALCEPVQEDYQWQPYQNHEPCGVARRRPRNRLY